MTTIQFMDILFQIDMTKKDYDVSLVKLQQRGRKTGVWEHLVRDDTRTVG